MGSSKLSKINKLSVLCALLVAVSLPALAEPQIQLDIPFNFTVDGKSLPAGHYIVTPVFDQNSHAWRIYSNQGSVVMLTSAMESSTHRLSLVFVQTDDGYALAQFWTGRSGQQLTAPKMEHTLMAGAKKYVEIAAK